MVLEPWDRRGATRDIAGPTGTRWAMADNRRALLGRVPKRDDRGQTSANCAACFGQVDRAPWRPGAPRRAP